MKPRRCKNDGLKIVAREPNQAGAGNGAVTSSLQIGRLGRDMDQRMLAATNGNNALRGVIWALGCGDAIGLPPVINFGTEEQQRRFLPGVLRGQERFCLGVTEPDGMAQDKCFQIDKDAVLTEDSWLRCG